MIQQTRRREEMTAQQIVFIRGTGRCGSKTLANQLNLHPAITKVPANECLPEELMDFTDQHVRIRCPQASNEALAEACRAYFEAYCSCSTEGKGIALHKATMNAHRLGSLLEYWPAAKIIYLVRHPLGVVRKLIEADIRQYKGAHGHATVANSLLRWANDVLTYLRSPAFGHRRVLHVRFEEMINDTDRFFAQIYRFLGVDDTFRHTLPGPVEYDDEFVLNGQERQWIIESTADIVRRLGYDPDECLAQLSDEHAGDVAAHPDRRLTSRPPALDGVELVRRALTEAAEQGWKRVGLFGAGYLSQLIGPYLDKLPAQVVCFLDENPARVGNSLDGFPIHHPQHAAELGLDAVIPLTLVHQRILIERWQRLYDDRIPIMPLWREQSREPVCV